MKDYKSYTDLQQSKKLAEFLPLESADMCWQKIYDENHLLSDYRIELLPFRLYSGLGIPAWSLAALLGVLPSRLFDSTPKRKELYLLPDLHKSYCFYRQFAVKTKGEIYLLTEGECLVDACYEMIIKLHELKML